MLSVRALLTLALVAAVSTAWAQPVDPYEPAPAPPAPTPDATPKRPAAPPVAPDPAPAPAPSTAPTAPSTPPTSPPGSASDPARAPGPGDAPRDPYAAPLGPDPLAERVAQALVSRAQELLDGRSFLDAKQLAVEALVKSPKGPSAEKARAIIQAVNQQLGIPIEMPRPRAEPAPVEDVDTTPIRDPTLPVPPPETPPEDAPRGGRLTAVVHGGLYAGLLGATAGSFLSSDSPAKGAVPVGLGVGAAGGLLLPRLVDRLGWSESRVRTIGSVSVWGGVVGGLFGDVARTEGTSAREVLVSASIGATLGGLGGVLFTQSRKLTPGDVALIDTLAGIGAAGGLTLGMAMQPVETEAYSVNAILGASAGVLVGAIAGPQTNTTPRRMLRVAGLAAAGGAAPLLLYAAISDSGSRTDERITGLLSTAGLLAGAYVGVRLTRRMDVGLDTLDGKPATEVDDAPIALVGRSSAGRWRLGGIALSPLSPALAPQPGTALQLLGGAF
jgi:hypothetical protein